MDSANFRGPSGLLIDPERRSLVVRIRTFYTDNPAEELNLRIVALKFGCTYETARKVIAALVASGFLESVHVIRQRAAGISKETV